MCSSESARSLRMVFLFNFSACPQTYLLQLEAPPLLEAAGGQRPAEATAGPRPLMRFRGSPLKGGRDNAVAAPVFRQEAIW